jgi:hypothetical protein
MKTIEVKKEAVINVLRLELISEIQALKKSLELYEIKYGKSLKEFEKEVLEGKEDFEKWDDYMEWKAYENTCKDRLSHLKDLKNAKNIRVITK